MSFLFGDSFDHYATADVRRKWSGQFTSAGFATATITGSAARSGAQGLRLTGGSGATNTPAPYITVDPATPESGVVGFAVRLASGSWSVLASTTRLLYVHNSVTEQFGVRVNTDGTLSVMRTTTVLGTTTAVLTTAWAYVEVKWTINDTTGSVEIHIDEVSALALTNVDNQNDTTAAWTTVRLGWFTGTAYTGFSVDLDDVYLCDLSGTVNNDFLGDMQVLVHNPNAAGTTSGWTRSTGADQWATIDEATQNGDTDYNSATTAPLIDTLNFPVLSRAGATIAGVQVCCLARTVDAGAAQVAAVVRSGTEHVASSQALSSEYLGLCFLYEINPATGLAWTEADFNAAEFGYGKLR